MKPGCRKLFEQYNAMRNQYKKMLQEGNHLLDLREYSKFNDLFDLRMDLGMRSSALLAKHDTFCRDKKCYEKYLRRCRK